MTHPNRRRTNGASITLNSSSTTRDKQIPLRPECNRSFSTEKSRDRKMEARASAYSSNPIFLSRHFSVVRFVFNSTKVGSFSSAGALTGITMPRYCIPVSFFHFPPMPPVPPRVGRCRSFAPLPFPVSNARTSARLPNGQPHLVGPGKERALRPRSKRAVQATGNHRPGVAGQQQGDAWAELADLARHAPRPFRIKQKNIGTTQSGKTLTRIFLKQALLMLWGMGGCP